MALYNPEVTTSGSHTFVRGQTITVGNTINQVGLTLNQNDTTNNPIGLSIANTGTNSAISITTSATTGNIINIPNADSLTSGGILNLVSNSADTTARNLVFIKNDNAAATGATPLTVTQDSTGQTLILNQVGTAAAYKWTATIQNKTAAQGANHSLLYINSNQADTSTNYGMVGIVADSASSSAHLLKLVHAGTGNAADIDMNGNGLGFYIDKDCTVNDTRTWASKIDSDNAGTGTALGCGIDMSSFSVDEPLLKVVADAITSLGTLSGQYAVDVGGTTYYVPYYTTGS